jgi:hypothetical protein
MVKLGNHRKMTSSGARAGHPSLDQEEGRKARFQKPAFEAYRMMASHPQLTGAL